MIHADEKKSIVKISGTSDTLVNEIGNVIKVLYTCAAKDNNSEYCFIASAMRGVIDDIEDDIEEKFDIDWDAYAEEEAEKDRPKCEAEVEKIKSSDKLTPEEKVAEERLVRAIFGCREKSKDKEDDNEEVVALLKEADKLKAETEVLILKMLDKMTEELEKKEKKNG